MERLGLGQMLNTSFSLHSVAEGSEIISEAEEIQEVYNLQYSGSRALEGSDYEEALRCYEEALEIDDTSIESLCGRAEVYINLGKYILAQLDAEKVLANYPKNTKALTLQGLALGHLGYYREALVAFLKALELTSNDEETHTQLASHITKMAEKYCSIPQKLAQRLPGMDPYKKLCEIGACLFQGRSYDLCIRVLNAAQKVETNQRGITMKVLLTLANAHSALKHNDLAISLYQDCLKTAQSAHDIPYQTKALVSIASLFLEMEETYQAIMYYEKLLDLQSELQGEDIHGPLPDYWSKDLQCALHLNLSISYKSIGSIDQAVNHAKIYMELIAGTDFLRDNAEALSHQNLGTLNDILGNFMQSLEHYKNCLELSRKNSDKKAIAQAYGCLGSIYAKLNNESLSKTYHEQSLSSTKALNDNKPILLAHEQYGDTLVYLKSYDEAVEQYMQMLRTCLRNDAQSQTKALCKIGTTYRALNCNQYSIYYFEQAKVMAEDFKLFEVKITCEYNLACILQNSTQLKELIQARMYLEKLIPEFEAKIMRHREEDTYCPQELKFQLSECYRAIQMVLIKLDENDNCLTYAEAARWQNFNKSMSISQPSLQQSTPRFDIWPMERLSRIVDQQNSTILYYTVFSASYLIWVLQPSKGIVRCYHWKTQDRNYNFSEEINREVTRLRSEGCDMMGAETEYENRSLPYKDEALTLKRNVNEKLKAKDSETYTENTMMDNTHNKTSPGQSLFKLLLSPVYDLLSDLEPSSALTIIPDGVLFGCPFGALLDWNGTVLAERFTLTCLPSLYHIDKSIQNEMAWMNAVDKQNFERVQSRLGGVSRLLHTTEKNDFQSGTAGHNLDTISTVDLENLNLKRTSNPRLITSGGLSRTNTSVNKLMQENTTISQKSRLGGRGMTRGDTFASTTVPVVPMTARSDTSLGSPTSLERMVGMRSLTTLTTRTATNTDITTSDSLITDFKQVCDNTRCVVIGNPALPAKLKLHGRDWHPRLELKAALSECYSVAEHFDVTAIEGANATKARFLEELKTASVIHIATRMCSREGFVVFSPNPDSLGSVPPEKSYIVTSEEIEALNLTTKLVVLSGGWGFVEKPLHHDGYKLPSAFIKAGAQCVLMCLWSVPSNALRKFFHGFYSNLRSGNQVAVAVREAVQALQKDNRYNSPCYWAPWQLIGKDTDIDILKMRHAMLDQELNRIEAETGDKMKKGRLNPLPVTPNVFLRNSLEDKTYLATREENLQILQECVGSLLAQHESKPDVIPHLVDMMDGFLKRLHMNDYNRRTTQLPGYVASHQGAVRLLKHLGFDFQSRGSETNEPYVVYPHWNKDDMALPAFDALLSSIDIVESPACAQAVYEALPLSQVTISHLVDMLCIAKNANGLQMKVSDFTVKPLWTSSKIKPILTCIGFQQIGTLLKFNNVPSLRKLLSACLQLMIAMSAYKSPVLLHKVDVSLLGVQQDDTSYKASSQSSQVTQCPLNSLAPVMLSRQQVRMSTPWMTSAEKPEEMREKVRLVRSKTDLYKEYRSHVTRAKTCHELTLSSQANESLDMIGQQKKKPLKVKVIVGSSHNVPVDHQVPLGKLEIDKRRDYGRVVLNQRMDDLSLRHRNEERKLFLPHIVNA